MVRIVKIKALPLDRHVSARMNKTETAFAAYLLGAQANKRIQRFDFEPEKFRLAELTFYTPDFRIVELDHSITFLDVKATVDGGPFYKDDSIVKIKTAAAMHPMYMFGITWRMKDGSWETREY